jgi:hypothetical protein
MDAAKRQPLTAVLPALIATASDRTANPFQRILRRHHP